MYVCMCTYVHAHNNIMLVSLVIHWCLCTHIGDSNFVVPERRLAVGLHTLDIMITTELGQVLPVPTVPVIIPGLFTSLVSQPSTTPSFLPSWFRVGEHCRGLFTLVAVHYCIKLSLVPLIKFQHPSLN